MLYQLSYAPTSLPVFTLAGFGALFGSLPPRAESKGDGIEQDFASGM